MQLAEVQKKAQKYQMQALQWTHCLANTLANYHTEVKKNHVVSKAM